MLFRAWSARACTSLERRIHPPWSPEGPQGGHTDGELVEHIRGVLAASMFLGEGYRKVWTKLRSRGIRTSRGRMLCLMCEHDLWAPPRSGVPRGPRLHEGTLIPPAPDMRWGTDLTGT